MEITLTGITTTGAPHLGNYVGAILPAIEASRRRDVQSFYFLADYHALVKCQDPALVHRSRLEVAATWLALGLDVENVIFYAQTDVPEILELTWILTCVTAKGLMNRAHAYKAAVADNVADPDKDPDKGISMGLFCYPILMAADILVYRATHVPVGEDQKQHLELTRDIAQKFNNDFAASIERLGYGDAFFPLPEPIIQGPAARVMSLRDGSKKMSKSDPSDYSRINLSDDADQIAQKIRKAKTDPDALPSENAGLAGRLEADNLVGVFAALQGVTKDDVLKQFGGQNFSSFKAALVDLAVAKLGPVGSEMKRLQADRAYIDDILRNGADRAHEIASRNMTAVKDILGFVR